MLNSEDIANFTTRSLIWEFYESPEELARFEPVAADDTPNVYRALLAHNEHMTVTLEKFFQTLVDVQVLEWRIRGNHYVRNSLLTRPSDGAVLQFCLVRLNFDHLDASVRNEIQAGGVPLGRILINHDVMRHLELLGLWKVLAGPELSMIFGSEDRVITYGRAAVINCDGDPAIEVLEIVAPVPDSSA